MDIYIFFGMALLGKGGSAKVSSHYFQNFSCSVKLVIYTFIGHDLAIIDVAFYLLRQFQFFLCSML